MADNNTVARPYAQAIFEVARENDALDELSASLQAAGELLSDGQVVRFLGQPSLNDDQRLEFLQGLFATAVGEGSVFAGGSRHGTNLLKLLLENGRVVALPEISAQFEALKAKVENSIDAVITAAAPLSAEQEKAIASSLAEKLGRETLTRVGLEDRIESYPAQLSGGQQQRVALARALVIQPEVLLLDEPLSALDAKVRGYLRHEIRALQERLGVTTIMVTHNMEQAIRFGNRLIMLHEGSIQLDISGEEKKAFTVQEAVKRFGATLKDESLLG